MQDCNIVWKDIHGQGHKGVNEASHRFQACHGLEEGVKGKSGCVRKRIEGRKEGEERMNTFEE